MYTGDRTQYNQMQTNFPYTSHTSPYPTAPSQEIPRAGLGGGAIFIKICPGDGTSRLWTLKKYMNTEKRINDFLLT